MTMWLSMHVHIQLLDTLNKLTFLYEKSANFLCKRPECKYFRLYGAVSSLSKPLNSAF